MTRLISVKSVNDLPDKFKEVISFQVVDNAIEAIVITVGEESVRVTGSGSYSNTLKVLAEQPKKQVTKYKLSGTVGGLVMQPEVYDSQDDADEKRRNYEYKFNFGELDLKIEPVVEFVEEDKI